MQHYVNESSVKWETRTKLFHFLYDPAAKKLDYQFLVIANKAALESKYHSLAFMYKGKIYSPEGYRPVRGQKAEMLSRNLYEQMDKWLIIKKELEEETVVIFNFLSCLLTAAHNQADLLALLPDCLKLAIDMVDTHNSPPVLTHEEIRAFHETHKEHIQTIKERIVLNMIT